ncbi:MAG: hypothetical protein ABSG64_14050 [Solirubrobacteraceae bacterium]|jgi:hypothetical protein
MASARKSSFSPPERLASLVIEAAGEVSEGDRSVRGADVEPTTTTLCTIVAAEVAAATGGLMGGGVTSGDSEADRSVDVLSFVPDRRTADPIALAISDWATRQGPTVVDFLYLANARVGGLPTPEAQVDAIESLQACQHALALVEPPSRHRYRRWLAAQPPVMEWATPWVIEKACGNWAQAKAMAAGQPLVPIAAAGAGRFGGSASKPAMLELVRQWHQNEPDERRRFVRFRAWVLQQLTDPSSRELAARVVCGETYRKHFGSWATVVAEAGLLPGMSFLAFRHLVGSPYQYSVDDMERYLRQWAAYALANGDELTVTSWSAWRDVELRQRWVAGIAQGLPGDHAIDRHWVTFLDALVDLGLVSSDEALRRRLARGDRLPLDELAALLRAAVRSCDGDLGYATYDAFRKRKSIELGRSVPCVDTVLVRLGARTLDEAVKIAEGMATHPAEDTGDRDETVDV